MTLMPKRSAALLLLLLAGCQTPSNGPTSQPGYAAGISTMLFFGLSRPDGSFITDADFDSFIEHEITPRFPDGFTVLRGDGHWREGAKEYREPSRILWIIHNDQPELDARIEQIRSAYCQQFHQTSVLRMDQPAAKILY